MPKDKQEKVRPRLNKEEYEQYLAWQGQHEALAEECEDVGLPVGEVHSYWYKGKHFSIYVKNTAPTDPKELLDAFKEEAGKVLPKPSVRPRKRQGNKYLVIDPADVHIGKLADAWETGESYNISKATKIVREAVEEILNKAVRLYGKKGIKQIILVMGNDILHTDNKWRKTTSGTPQDTDGMWHKAYRAAYTTYLTIIESLLSVANVHCVFCPSNHDYETGFYLAHAVEATFKNNSRISFDVSAQKRKYVKVGVTMLGFTHGDGAKEADLQRLMMEESRKKWGNCKRGKWFCHHLHHKIRVEWFGKKKALKEKDYGSISVVESGVIDLTDCDTEYVRSPSATDSWHHQNGYQHAPKMIEAWIFDDKAGEEDKIVSIVG